MNKAQKILITAWFVIPWFLGFYLESSMRGTYDSFQIFTVFFDTFAMFVIFSIPVFILYKVWKDKK